MAPAVKPIPEGYRSITPYLIIKGAARAIEFYKQAFGATEIMRFPGPNNTIGHAELRIGDSVIMLADESKTSFTVIARVIWSIPLDTSGPSQPTLRMSRTKRCNGACLPCRSRPKFSSLPIAVAPSLSRSLRQGGATICSTELYSHSEEAV